MLIVFAPLFHILFTGLFHGWGLNNIAIHLDGVLTKELLVLDKTNDRLDPWSVFEKWRVFYGSLFSPVTKNTDSSVFLSQLNFPFIDLLSIFFYSWSIAAIRGLGIAYSLFLFFFMVMAASISGWIRWYERRTGAEPESGYLYHWLRTKVIFISSFAIALYILPPWHTSILWTIVPALVGAAILVRYQVAFFKKHL